MNKKLLLAVVIYVLLLISIPIAFWYFSQKQNTSKPAEFFCPVPRKYCKTAKELKVGGRYFGLGYNLPSNTPIYAMFDGKIRDGVIMLAPQAGGGTYPVYSLTKNDKSITVTYISSDIKSFVDTTSVRRKEIFKLSGNNIASSSSNLIIRAYRIIDGKSETIKLTPAEFGYE